MKIALFHNSNAGDGEASHRIATALARHGHELVALVEDEADAGRLLEAPSDLVVAAGGDGTVALVARAIAGHGVPMGILPLGTANNVALTLGIDGSLDDLVKAWHLDRRRRFDIGTARGPWGERLFVESVGVGLIAAGIFVADDRPRKDVERLASSVPRTAQIYREALSTLLPRRYTVTVDGHVSEGDFLLVEALNIRFVGANLVLAQAADPSDGLLTVVLARLEDRAQLDEYLRRRLEGIERPIQLPTCHGRVVEIDAAGSLHVDDDTCSAAGERVSLEVGCMFVEVLS